MLSAGRSLLSGREATGGSGGGVEGVLMVCSQRGVVVVVVVRLHWDGMAPAFGA